jgi:putative nucleotidyltransferase with HDIG domain
LEWLLLDHFHGSETSLEPVRGFAHDLGADPIDLEKVARCITRIRRLARRWCVPQFTDGRDYLAITYLTLLGLLKFAGQGHTEAINERWALALFWVLEESLDLLLKREPFNREQEGYQPLAHLGAEWIRAAGAPLRVHELCATADGKTVLQPVVALRGVLQGSYHHLDAYRHTLTVLAYVEALIEDPVGRLLDPIGLDREVTESLAEAGLVSAPFLPNQAAEKIETLRLSEDHFGILKAFPKFSLSAEDKLLLKWCALFHDVGKPGTRTIRRKGKVAEVQFIGHEVYGLTLLRDRLEEWFPIQEQRLRLANLIRNHHYCHHLLGDYLLNAPNPEESSPLVKLIRLLQGEPRPEMVRWLGSLRDENNKDYRPDLTLLLLHGFADRLAARGLKQSNTVTEWAVAVLTLVTALRREPGLSDTEKSRKEQQKAKGLAAITWAEELVQRKQLQDGKRTQAVRLLKTSLEQTSGTAAELMDYLRVHTNVEALRQQLETL